MNANTRTSQRRGWLTITVMLLGTVVWTACQGPSGGGGGDSSKICDDGDPCTTDLVDQNGQCRSFAVECAADETCNADTGQCEQDEVEQGDKLPDDSGTDPDTTDPDTTGPDTTDPDTTGPDTTVPDTTVPDITDPDTTDPGPVDPPSLDPDPTDPDPVEPPPVGPDPVDTDPCDDVVCDDSDPCTTDTCDGAGQCVYTPGACGTAESCVAATSRYSSSGVPSPCGPAEECDATTGTCVNRCDSLDCDDGIPCTVDSCDTATGSCQNLADDSFCDDTIFCNGEETCGESGCVAGTPPCSDREACDEGLGQCLLCLHRATVENTQDHQTELTHALADGDAEAILQVTQNWNAGGDGGAYNDAPHAVWYDGAKWKILNLNGRDLPLDASFNVKVVAPSAWDFVHQVPAGNIFGSSTMLDHPATNGNPTAILIVTPNLIPEGSGTRVTINNAHIGVFYSGTNWFVYNEDDEPMPEGAAFNVSVYQPSASVFTHMATPDNTVGNTTKVFHPLIDDNPDAILHVTQNRTAGNGVENDAPVGVGYFGDDLGGFWVIINDNRTVPMTLGAGFNVMIDTDCGGI